MTPNDLRLALSKHPHQVFPALPGRTNHLQAGIMVPICWSPTPTCLLTLRSPNLRNHANEVSFPGGKPDPGDVDLSQTAIRETEEELGLSTCEIVGRLSSTPLYTSDFRLEPYVAVVPDGPLNPNPAEVAAVLRVSLLHILQQPQIDAIPTEAWKDKKLLSPIFTVEGYQMYGGTAFVFYELLTVVAPIFGLPIPPLVPGRFQWQDLFKHRASAGKMG